MKNFLRNWLGINEDVTAIAADMSLLLKRSDSVALQIYQVFHAIPFAAGVLALTSKSAAALTQPAGIEANSLSAVLMGVILHARQGDSQFEIQGELPADVRKELMKRGFKLEEFSGSGGTATYIIWA